MRIHGGNYASAHIANRDARVLGLRERAGSGSVFLGGVEFEPAHQATCPSNGTSSISPSRMRVRAMS